LIFSGEAGLAAPSPFLAAMQAGRNLHISEGTARHPDGSLMVLERWSGLIREGDKVVGAVISLADVTLERAARSSLRHDHAALGAQVRDLYQHSTEMALFGQLAEMLQACSSLDELCRIVASFAKRLFPADFGSLSILEPVNGTLDAQVSWGGPDGPLPLAAPFRQQDCWALRRGKPHYQDGPHENIFCTHTLLPLPAYTFCLPLMGQGATLGHLHLRAGAAGQLLSEARRLVAIALAYQVALGLSNLKLKETLREEAIRDPVTGLFNRRFMQESLAHEIQRARRAGTSVAVIAFDIDHFKEANDKLGHAAGDSLLAGLAEIAKAGLRAEDLSCRQGGDEFLLILPDIAETGAQAVAEKLRAELGRFTQHKFPELAGRITLSLGLAFFPRDAATPESLLKAADQALYRAKTLGRNQAFSAAALQGDLVAQ
jgi:diguanylate cyclase (GGDEF)-like protein